MRDYQSRLGSSTVSLARAGANVTGVDFSGPALTVADALAARAGVQARWVETDVLDARRAVDREFDVVYTSIGTITWLEDLNRWAEQIHALLRPGGIFYIRDGHPALYALDEEAPDLTTRYRYFGDGRAQLWDDPSTYIGDGTVVHSRTYEWPHPLSEILGPTFESGTSGPVKEWCINTAAVDPATKSILVNSEDGYLYRWDLVAMKLSQKIQLTSGVGEAYTPTAIGADGAVYAINNAVLFSIAK